MEMKWKTEDGNGLEKYLVEIAREIDAILKGKVSSCQLIKVFFVQRKGIGKCPLNLEVLFQTGCNFFW